MQVMIQKKKLKKKIQFNLSMKPNIKNKKIKQSITIMIVFENESVSEESLQWR